jgi:hypothetical protein
LSGYSTRVSATTRNVATTSPSARGGAVGRSNSDSRRVRIGAGERFCVIRKLGLVDLDEATFAVAPAESCMSKRPRDWRYR